MAKSDADISKILIISSDDILFQVDRKIANKMKIIDGLVSIYAGQGQPMKEPFPLPNVNAKVFRKILEYLEYHQNDDEKETTEDKYNIKEIMEESSENTRKTKSDLSDLCDWDKRFLRIPKNEIFELIAASNYLNIKELFDLTCKCVANMISSKSPREIRKYFNIANDFSDRDNDKLVVEYELNNSSPMSSNKATEYNDNKNNMKDDKPKEK